MARLTVRLDVPEALTHNKKLKQDYLTAVEQSLKEQGVLRLFEQGEISSGYGAELLGISRYDFILLLGKRGVPYLNYDSPDEVERDVQAALAAVKAPARARRRKR